MTSRARLNCTNCSLELEYPLGARYVRCANCQNVNTATGGGSYHSNIPSQGNGNNGNGSGNLGQVVCGGCRQTLLYALGAQQVECASCRYTNRVTTQGPRIHTLPPNAPNIPAYFRCSGCSVVLVFPMGASAVRCTVCHCVTNVNQRQQQQQQPAPVQAAPVNAVFVENPGGSLDLGMGSTVKPT